MSSLFLAFDSLGKGFSLNISGLLPNLDSSLVRWNGIFGQKPLVNVSLLSGGQQIESEHEQRY